jgi:DNA polymerase III epsilon subunit-like protein
MSGAVWVMVDVEATGPVPGLYSMTEIGAVVVEPGLDRTFYGRLRPVVGSMLDADAMAVTGRTADEIASWPAPEDTMGAFDRWLRSLGGRPLGVSDNNGFDFAFVNWYFWRFCGDSPFGHSSTNLGSLYKGLVRNTRKNFKHLRDTPHTHNPLDDARGNAEAMLKLATEYGLGLE